MSLVDDAKVKAKQLRSELRKRGQDIPHAKALDQIADQAGFKNWNTYSAALRERDYALLLSAGLQCRSGSKQAFPIDSSLQPKFHSGVISEEKMPSFVAALSCLPPRFEAIHDLIVFLLFSGCRVTEVIQLKSKHIDLTGRGFFINEMSSIRRFPLNDELFRVANRLKNKSGYLFADASKKNLMLQKQWSKDLFRKHGNYDLNFNSLRSTFIDTALQVSPLETASLVSGTHTVMCGFKLKQERSDGECLLKASNLVAEEILRQARKQTLTQQPVCK